MRVQSAKQFPEHQGSWKKQDIKMSAGFRSLSKETKITPQALFNCRYQSLQQKEQTQSNTSFISPRQTFRKSNGFKKDKEHK